MKLYRRGISGNMERYLEPVNIAKIAPVTAIITARTSVSSYALKELPDILFPKHFEYAYVGSLSHATDDNDVADLLDAGAVYILDYEAYSHASPISWMGYYPLMDTKAYSKALSTNEDYAKLNFIWKNVYQFFVVASTIWSNDMNAYPNVIAQALDQRIGKIGLPAIDIQKNWEKSGNLHEIFEAIRPEALSGQYEQTAKYIKIAIDKIKTIPEENADWTIEAINRALDDEGMSEIDEAVLAGVPLEDIEQ